MLILFILSKVAELLPSFSPLNLCPLFTGVVVMMTSSDYLEDGGFLLSYSQVVK